MFDKVLFDALKPYLMEHEVRMMIDASKQAWQQRKPKIRAAAGFEVRGLWFYDRRKLNRYFQETGKYRPKTV